MWALPFKSVVLLTARDFRSLGQRASRNWKNCNCETATIVERLAMSDHLDQAHRAFADLLIQPWTQEQHEAHARLRKAWQSDRREPRHYIVRGIFSDLDAVLFRGSLRPQANASYSIMPMISGHTAQARHWPFKIPWIMPRWIEIELHPYKAYYKPHQDVREGRPIIWGILTHEMLHGWIAARLKYPWRTAMEKCKCGQRAVCTAVLRVKIIAAGFTDNPGRSMASYSSGARGYSPSAWIFLGLTEPAFSRQADTVICKCRKLGLAWKMYGCVTQERRSGV